MAAVPSVEELLASIPGIHKGGDGNAAPAAAASEPEAQQPASKRRKGGAAKEAKADAAPAQPQPAADAAGAGAQVHSISDAVVVTTVECPAGVFAFERALTCAHAASLSPPIGAPCRLRGPGHRQGHGPSAGPLGPAIRSGRNQENHPRATGAVALVPVILH